MNCSVEGCERSAYAKGWCRRHYQRWYRHGHPEAGGATKGSHGHSWRGGATPTYRSWVALRNRCTNPNNPMYPYYGGRGITYDPRWDDFAVFLEDMGKRPEGTSIDRVDNDGNYTKENCRWATPKEQMNNRRPAHLWRNASARTLAAAGA